MASKSAKSIREVIGEVAQLLNIFGTDEMEMVHFLAARAAVRHVKQMCNAVVYSTPPSRYYKRTGFLRESVYCATMSYSTYDEALANASHRVGQTQQSMRRRTGDPLRDTKFEGLAPNYEFGRFQHSGSRKKAIVVAGAVYAEEVEYGTGWNVNYGPRPFVRAGMDSAQQEMEQILTDGLSAINSRIARGRARDALGRFVRNAPQ